MPEIIWWPPRGSSVYLAHISNKERSDEVSPPNAADPPSAAGKEIWKPPALNFKVSTKKKKKKSSALHAGKHRSFDPAFLVVSFYWLDFNDNVFGKIKATSMHV